MVAIPHSRFRLTRYPKPIKNFMSPRMVMIDDNIRDSWGHYLNLLTYSEVQQGQRFQLSGHPQAIFTRLGNRSTLQGLPALRYASTLHWSLGIDGDFLRTKFKRANSKSFLWRTFSILLQDVFCKRSRRPSGMIMNWKRAFLKLLDSLDLTEHDHLVLNTANDFVILATASALQDRQSKKLNIHAIFHFATNHADTAHGEECNAKMGQQMNMALGALGHHQVYIHTMTEELKAEINSVMDRDSEFHTRLDRARQPSI